MNSLTERLLSGDYLAGFADGEGCFLINARPGMSAFQFAFQLTQRDDGSRPLILLHKVFGGWLYGEYQADKRERFVNTKPRIVWMVSARTDVLKLIEYFDEHLPILKHDQYLLWKEAALVYFAEAAHKKPNSQWLRGKMVAYKEQLSAMKKYCADNAYILDEATSSQHSFQF